MNWDAIGAVGEVIGGVGVIATLLYLSLQIRQNTRATERQSLRDATDFLHSCYRPIIDDEGLAEIFPRGMKDYDNLTLAERERFHYLNVTQLQAATSVLGLMGPEDTSIPSMLDLFDRRMSNIGYRKWWTERGQHVVAPDYFELIDGIHRKHEQGGT